MRISASRIPRSRSAFTLIEVLIALLVIAGVIAASVAVIRVNAAAMVKAEEAVRTRMLVEEIYEEIAAFPREAPSATGRPVLPRPAARTEYTSVIDYNGLEESPPTDPLGTPISGAEGFSRRVMVRVVDPQDTEREVAESESRLIEVTVEISRGEESLRRTTFLRSLE